MERAYEQIRKEIERKMECGDLREGDKLPREIDLCRSFDVSRTTVRRALEGLVKEGKLRRVKGTGTFVSRPQTFERTTLFLQSFAEELKQRGLSPVTEVLEFRILPFCGEHIGEGLGILPSSRVLKLRRLRYSEEEREKGPITLTTSYFPADIGELLLACDFERESLYHALSVRKIFRVRSEKTVSASHLPLRDCRLLSAQEDDLFFLVSTRSYDKAGRQIEFCESYYPLDRNVLTFRITNE